MNRKSSSQDRFSELAIKKYLEFDVEDGLLPVLLSTCANLSFSISGNTGPIPPVPLPRRESVFKCGKISESVFNLAPFSKRKITIPKLFNLI